MSRFLFPRWSNALLPFVLVVGAVLPLYAAMFVAYGFSPKTLEVGYMPKQPVPYSHALHAGTLGIDCRYCHSTVEQTGFAAIPPTQTCMNCHWTVKTDSAKLLPVRESWATGKPIEWVQIHETPDYVYFNHSAHVNSGVSCVECHGRIDQMDVVAQAKPLSMSWCLDCHRAPENFLRPIEQVTNLAWTAAEHPEVVVDGKPTKLTQQQLGEMLAKKWKVNPPESCGTCHR